MFINKYESDYITIGHFRERQMFLEESVKEYRNACNFISKFGITYLDIKGNTVIVLIFFIISN